MPVKLLHVVTAGMPVVEECNVRAAISPVLRVVRMASVLAGWLATFLRSHCTCGLSYESSDPHSFVMFLRSNKPALTVSALQLSVTCLVFHRSPKQHTRCFVFFYFEDDLPLKNILTPGYLFSCCCLTFNQPYLYHQIYLYLSFWANAKCFTLCLLVIDS